MRIGVSDHGNSRLLRGHKKNYARPYRGDQKDFIPDGKMMEWPHTTAAIEIRRTTVEFREVKSLAPGGVTLSSKTERPA